MTTEDVIKILPFEEAFKSSLLNNFDQLNADKKFAMEQLLWNAYYAIYQARLEENTQLGLLRAEKGEEKLDDNFYKRIVEQTEKEMQQEGIQTKEKVDLSAARQAMEVIVKEIHAAKKH